MPLLAYLRTHQGVLLGAVVVGGIAVYQVFWKAAPIEVKAQGREERTVRASVDAPRTLHGQVDDLQKQLETLVGSVTTMAKGMKGLQHEVDDGKEARKQERLEAAQREKRLQEELERERARQAKPTTTPARLVPKQAAVAPPRVVPPPPLFELRTIGSSKDRPKNAPSPLVHHVDTAQLPAGCFAKVRMVTGTDATSQLGSSGGASWGHPMLFVIREAFECAYQLSEIGLAVTRSQTRVPLDGCLGFATAKADLASSRVQGEATILSCVMPDGESYEVPIKGFLVGADGKQGIFGEVQSHESAKIGKAFAAGMIEEAAAFFSAARKGVTISVNGQSTPYGGMETTLNKIATYWLAQASALQPTIPVPSGTEAYLVMLQGVPLEGMHVVNWLKSGVM